MTYGILGNTIKEALWEPVAALVRWLIERDASFCLHHDIAEGLSARGLIDSTVCSSREAVDVAEESDLLLSFGGDGTILKSAHEAGTHETPILGVNLGRLGFLTKVEVSDVEAAIESIDAGDYAVEERMTLAIEVESASPDVPSWALNDVVIGKTGTANMIGIEAEVDGAYLNTYRCDGLIVATPTGSTAYSLSADGPIVAPASRVLIVTPIAPHTLTARPIVLPFTVTVTLRVVTPGPFLIAVDGKSAVVEEVGAIIHIRRADHAVRLVTFSGRDYFSTLRSKLKWGEEKGQPKSPRAN